MLGRFARVPVSDRVKNRALILHCFTPVKIQNRTYEKKFFCYKMLKISDFYLESL